MRVGSYEVVLQAPLADGGGRFPEVMDSNGKAVAIATPGANFEVLVTVHPSCDVKFSHNLHAEAHLSLDGVSPGYSNLFNQANTTSFKYFSGGAQPASLPKGKAKAAQSRASLEAKVSVKYFSFGKPEASEEESAAEWDPENSQLGRLIVTIKEVHRGAPTASHGHVKDSRPKPQAATKMPEGKKFFMAPSLTADGGASGVETLRFSENSWTSVRTLATLTLLYETADTLLLRKVLRFDNPQHATILAAAGLGVANGGPKQASPLAQGNAPPTSRVKKEKPAVKAEPSQRGTAQRGPAAAGERICIDLTSDDAPAPRVKRERLSCDLTAAEGGPKWDKVKKAKESTASAAVDIS